MKVIDANWEYLQGIVVDNDQNEVIKAVRDNEYTKIAPYQRDQNCKVVAKLPSWLRQIKSLIDVADKHKIMGNTEKETVVGIQEGTGLAIIHMLQDIIDEYEELDSQI